MKNLFLALSLIITLQCFAQDPDLFDNQWYLEELVIDSEVIPALSFPPEPKIGRILFTNQVVHISFCDSHTSDVVYDLNQDIFTLDIFFILGGDCERQENYDFERIYLSIFHEDDIPINPFSYDIVPGGGGFLALTVTNGEGNQAIYGNVLLSSSDNNLNEIKIYPNPSNSKVFIESQKDIVKKIKLYSLLGENIQTHSNNLKSIDVSDLASGIYLLRIFTEQGSTVKKIIKQ
jgi:Secretion system C-terminal sorting domain